MANKHLQDQLSLWIIRSTMKGKYALVQMAEARHITLMQAHTLCLLEPGQSTPMKALSIYLSCDPSNITSLIEQLVTEGLVERKEANFDRRVKVITLTDKGVTLRDEILTTVTSTRLQAGFDRLNEQEVEQLAAILKKVTDADASRGAILSTAA